MSSDREAIEQASACARDIEPPQGGGKLAHTLEPLIAASARLGELIALDDELIAEYRKVVTIIEIEYDSHVIDSALGAEPSVSVAERFESLEAMRDRLADMRLQVEADEEVRRLLS